jgi:1-acyl-sn-glycerol-3-phosphate acyltransferase
MTRDQLLGAILGFLAGDDPPRVEPLREPLAAEIDAFGPEALRDLEARLIEDHGWAYHAPDALARHLHHFLAARLLSRGTEAVGLDHLDLVPAGPLVLMSNHLSYADANAVEVLLHRGGRTGLAGRLTALAGPKVFTSRRRRFSSLCFGTIKVPQSADVSSEEATLTARDVARAARQSITAARARLTAGDALLLFAEGTRSRTGAMGPLRAGAARYLETPGTWVVPMALTGPEAFFPIEATTVHPARVVLRVGTPIAVDALLAAVRRDRATAVDALGLAIATLLPPAYRGFYADPSAFVAAGQALRRAGTGSSVAHG